MELTYRKNQLETTSVFFGAFGFGIATAGVLYGLLGVLGSGGMGFW